MGLYFGIGVRELRKRHALNDNYRILLLALSGLVVAAAGALLWLRFINPFGYFVTSIIGVSVFTTFYALTGRLSQKTNVEVHRVLRVLFAVAGIVMLVLSLAVAYHVEAKLTPVGHSAAIVQAGFTLSHPIPDSEVVQNLTTADHVGFEIIVARLAPDQTEASGFSVQVTNQSASAPTSPYIFFYVNNVTNWASRSWSRGKTGPTTSGCTTTMWCPTKWTSQ